ncbi:MAG: type IV pilus assembly protein PilM [Candidatus Gottesmanbacteria bacterium GW2011_GWB1_43_11]|uniref:Type IV pilus assembly protein PilM n=1 Tax=Candidatus Gottesmanbacteria bacterium GW2011_GWB1_43_11 TaxID=1618446 RepID=A0A0G1ESY2_9BACT|nr:MAG: type IV pilus assembly protein PilM [Candidatus Gottesmanbacteria bacterium GW2011_GWA2_42_16]KKS52336.1 MAG: type IV pilus assembly protein PilM [Candidatus Gottesmanbacteria bacterium GW2011_GWA1_42_26]KKS86191.1 MAG: type IV pilus assembly protein PilM [Candidatus Gottesmanbacteria bacterium GW2011_GWB1_43_11]OGG07921.1 MAG: hypothetical protein A2699_02985 [Candidatus Gottesmanbacteria bacterium RIFCSPHIGHO2_01_FULL_43_15]
MAKPVLGLDLGSKYIKYVEMLQLGKGRFELKSVGMTQSPAKGLNSDADIDHEAMATVIKKLFKDGNVRTHVVNVALPETNVFTRVIQVPPLSERELSSAIKWEAEQYIPLPLAEVQMDFSIVGESLDTEGNKKLDVLLVAAPKIVIERYNKVLDLCDLEVSAMETEIISASRALLPSVADKPLTVLVINLGAQTTDFSILKGGVIIFTRSIPTGGVSFTQALSQDLGFPVPQAEEYKKTYGLQKDQLEGKVYHSLKPLFSVISEEIKRALTYIQDKYPDEVISSVILSGGGAKLPGMVEIMVEETGIETQVGNPWTRVQMNQERFNKLKDEGVVFAVAVGLAMREI